jgi:Icc-related predicted phosphoesterase
MADTHGFHARLTVPTAELLIHAGDLTANGTRPQVEAALRWLQSLPHRHKVLVAGNHDFLFEQEPELAERLARDAGLHYLRDSEVTLEGLRIWGTPWQPRFFDWAFNLDRGAPLAAKWSLIPAGVDVLITHGPPAGYGDLCLHGGRVGCADLLEHLGRVKPRVNLFGHIHENRGEWLYGPTRLINCTVAECELPVTLLTL